MNTNLIAEKTFGKTYKLPYLMGPILAVNAVSDACLVIDGANCVMSKADILAGNHDLFSTIFSADGRHRIICTMTTPVNPQRNPEKNLSALLNSVAGLEQFKAVLLTALPFCSLSGMDYSGIARAVKEKTPVLEVAGNSLSGDCLDAYDQALTALARIVPSGRRGRSRRKVAVIGYMFDRNEFDHKANLREMFCLLKQAGLELVSVWPSGGTVAELSKVSEAGLIISLPYARRTAAVLAEKYGVPLLETGLPIGLRATVAWLSQVRNAAGIAGSLPRVILEEERSAARIIAPALRALANKKVVFAGDPYVYAAFDSYARELGMSVPYVFLNSSPKQTGAVGKAVSLSFGADVHKIKSLLLGLNRYEKPDLMVGDSFAISEGFALEMPFVEFGFPSFGHHCLTDEPFFGFTGARVLTSRILNSLQNSYRPPVRQ